MTTPHAVEGGPIFSAGDGVPAASTARRRTGVTGIRRAGVALTVLLTVVMLAGPVLADADGYTDNYSGDVNFTVSIWDQGTSSYKVAATQASPGKIRQAFDAGWSTASAAGGSFCTALAAGIQAGDGGFDGTTSCTPANQAELRAKNLGTNLIGLRYFIPGNGSVEYAFNHKVSPPSWSNIPDFDISLDVYFDLTIDVVLRVAPGVGPESDPSTPLSIQSARLSFSNAWFDPTGCPFSVCPTDPTGTVTADIDAALQQAELALDSTVVDVTGIVSSGMTDANNQIHGNLAQYSALLGPYLDVSASFDSTALAVSLLKDVIPTVDSTKPLATLAWTTQSGQLIISTQGVFGVDTGGRLWEQTSFFSGPWGHWYDLGTPSGTAAASGPAALQGSDGTAHAFITAADGHLYEQAGSQWVDRGIPPRTTAVGTPATATAPGVPGRVIVRGANGHIELLSERTPGTWRWRDLGSPGGAFTTFTPAVVASGRYAAVLVTLPNGHLEVRESRGAAWRRWRDLGVLPSPAATAPSAVVVGTSVTAYVTGADQQIEQATFRPFGAATVGTLPAPFPFPALPPIGSAPSVVTGANGDPTIFASDTDGDLVQLVGGRLADLFGAGSCISLGAFGDFCIPLGQFGDVFGYVATNYGTLLDAAMGPPTALASSGPATAFAVASNQHVGEALGTRGGLIDHTALSPVTYQAHGYYKPVIIGGFSPRVLLPPGPVAGERWGSPVQAGQSDSFSPSLPEAFRLEATLDGAVQCQALVPGVLHPQWLPEVGDSQTCGNIGQGNQVLGMRLRLANAASGPHLLYRCNTGTWSPWLADGTWCSLVQPLTGFQPLSAIQVQFSDAPLASVTYRAKSEPDAGWQPWVDEGGSAGGSGTPLEAIEVHSNVGGSVRCNPYVQGEGWQGQVGDSASCGTLGQGKALQAFSLQLLGAPLNESMEYRSYETGVGWGPWVSEGGASGTPGQGQIEQVQMRFIQLPPS